MTDILLAVPKNQIYGIIDEFNFDHDRLRFTIEHNYEGTVDFLDINLRIIEGQIR